MEIKLRISALLSSVALVLLSGCAAPAKVSPTARLPIAEVFLAEGASPSVVSVTSKVESENCRMGPMPNGREAELSVYLANTIRLSQLSAGAPRVGPALAIDVTDFKIDCGKIPTYVELRGIATRSGSPPKEIHVKEIFDFALLGVEVVQNMTEAFDIAVEKFAVAAVRR